MTQHIGIIVAARTMSSRLPRKALLPLQGTQPMIQFLLERLKPSKTTEIVFATTDLDSDDELAATVEKTGIPVYRGSANDLIARYVGAAEQFGFEIVGRITGDCPFVNSELVDYGLGRLAELKTFDLASTKGAFPVGLDVEFYRAETMKRIRDTASLSEADREHLTLYFYNHPNEFSIHTIPCPTYWQCQGRAFTVDTPEDFAAAKKFANLFDNSNFSLGALVERATA